MIPSVDEIQIHFDPAALTLLNIVLGIVMFGVALDINVDDFKHIFRNPKAKFIGLFCQFFLLPASAFAIISLMDPRPSIALGIILVASCPGGNLSNFFTSFSGGNTALSITMSAVSTLCSIIMTPFNIAFWGGMNPGTAQILQQIEIDHWSIFTTILTILVIPSILGILVKDKFPVFAEKAKKTFHIVSFLFFLVFVGIALKINFDHFMNYVGSAFWIVLLTNGWAVSLGLISGKLFKLSQRDTQAISFEIGIQNTAFGLILIFSFFNGLGGMAIIAAWWGIWHVISGGSLALFWGRNKHKISELKSFDYLEN
jgi:BASS family bile acid:Na+ symporter